MSTEGRFSRHPRGLMDWCLGVRRFALRVTAVSFGFTMVLTLALAFVQQVLLSSGPSAIRIAGIRIAIPRPESTGALTLTFALAILVWAVVLSVSQLVVARQVRGYLVDLTSRDTDRHLTPPQLMAERLMVETLLALLAASARVLALTAVLAYLLPGLAAVGLAVTLLVLLPVSLHRYRRAVELRNRFAGAARSHRSEADPQTARDYIDAIFARDTSMYRLPLVQMLILVGTILIVVGLPAWISSDSAGGAGLLLLLVWIQGVLRVATECGVLGWRWQQRAESGNPSSAAWAD